MPLTSRKRKPLGPAKTATKPVGKPRGRNGGRKKAVARTASVRIAEEILECKRYVLQEGDPLPDSATPLDIMLCAMRTAYKRAGPEAATVYAVQAAPYLHARIAQMELKNTKDEAFKIEFAWAGDTNGI
jgi:hypothetical protein